MLFVYLFLLFFISIINAQNAVSVGSPVANQPITPGDSVPIQYTILKLSSTNNVNSISTSYPSSIDVVFRWQAIDNNAQKPLEFSARTNLPTDPFPGGIKDQSYQQYWKSPSQKFFDRYKPAQWKFFLVFQLKYPNPSKIINTQMPQQQSKEIAIPLEIQPSSSTVKHGGHHKKEAKAST
ncbi:hypothetical protein K501DRAFT_327923 [Backusella circina FSU 941]|nr:hypothetical protein K501DRAFT_327923 [Backusella circina FSU 941]